MRRESHGLAAPKVMRTEQLIFRGREEARTACCLGRAPESF